MDASAGAGPPIGAVMGCVVLDRMLTEAQASYARGSCGVGTAASVPLTVVPLRAGRAR